MSQALTRNNALSAARSAAEAQRASQKPIKGADGKNTHQSPAKASDAHKNGKGEHDKHKHPPRSKPQDYQTGSFNQIHRRFNGQVITNLTAKMISAELAKLEKSAVSDPHAVELLRHYSGQTSGRYHGPVIK